MDRRTALWTLVLFFGASLMFATIKNATEDESAGVALGAQVAGGAAAGRRDHRVRPPQAVTRWIVDGMNVIGSRPDGWWRDRRGAMRRLVEELGALARASAEPVTVVLDGSPFDLDGGPVEVRFASRRGPNAADDDIAAIVAADPSRATCVWSPRTRRSAARVREHGAEVEGAGAFRRRLDGLGGGG